MSVLVFNYLREKRKKKRTRERFKDIAINYLTDVPLFFMYNALWDCLTLSFSDIQDASRSI